MSVSFFRVPVFDAAAAEAALNQFLASHRVAHVEKQLIQHGADSCWAVCVTWVAGAAEATLPSGGDSRRNKGIDYKEVLTADEFALYDKLRQLRKQRAEAEGLPTYAVFTNEQLAAMVQARVNTAAGLRALDGVGEAREKRYGPDFLQLLQTGTQNLPAAPPTPQAP